MSVNTSGGVDFRNWYVNGPAMVYAKGGAHMSGGAIANRSEVGLSVDAIQIKPRFKHRDIRIDDFGADIPAEIMIQLAEVQIEMTLINFDPLVVNICYAESTGMFQTGFLNASDRARNRDSYYAGTLGPAGLTLGKGVPVFASGCQFISLSISANNNLRMGLPWRFPASYLVEAPHIYPLGTETSKVQLTWRAIPYRPLYASGGSQSNPSAILINGIVHTPREIMSSGVVLWDRTLDSFDQITNSGFIY